MRLHFCHVENSDLIVLDALALTCARRAGEWSPLGCVECGLRSHGVDPLYSTLTQTSTEMLSLPVIGFLSGSVLMCKYLPSILN
ncbi:hypothetical protein R69927_03085 [Paraburkholderia domus]|nr:hypothetical protein R70006_02590 [Paraburkholderia domus]CAE6867646.1 hypothetical protein R69927_03085 [Paraburkholderia domus]